MSLPRLGEVTTENQVEVVNHLDNLARESSDDRAEWDSVVEECHYLFLYSDDHQPADDKVRVPLTQSAVVATVNTQTSQLPAATIEPVENGEPPVFYWNGPEEQGLMLGLPPEYVVGYLEDPMDPASMAEPLPLPTELAEQLKATALSPEQAPVLPPGYIRPEWVTECDDRTVAETLQTVFDVIRGRSRTDPFLRKFQLTTTIAGTGYALYEWDDVEKRYILTPLPFTQVHIDQTSDSVQDAAFVGIDLPMDADRAMAMYPSVADVIEANAATGRPAHEGVTMSLGGQHDKDYQRKTVTFRVFWLRHQPMPMSEEEALQSGAVEQTEVIDEASAVLPGVGGGVGAGGGDALAPDESDDVPIDSEGVAGAVPAGDVPQLDDVPAASPAPARLAYILTDTGAEVAPGGRGWPEKLGIRQITVIVGGNGGSQVVDDRECEFVDIPILHNINIPRPGASPIGMGEPMRLKGLQLAINRTVNAMVKQNDYNAFGVHNIPQSVANAMTKEYKSAKVRPDMTLIWPDNLYQQMGGKMGTTEPPAPLSPAAMELAPLLKSLMDESSGHTPALKGQAPSADASGKMVELLQSSGVAMMTFKAQRFGETVESLANLSLNDIVRRMTLDDVLKIVSRYKRHVLAKLVEKWEGMEWNVKVRIEAIAEGVKQQKLAMIQVLMPLGLVDPQTASEWLNLDYRVVRQRQMAHQQWLAGQGMGLPGQEQQGEGEEKQDGPPKNDKQQA